VRIKGEVEVDFGAIMERMRRIRASIAPIDSVCLLASCCCCCCCCCLVVVVVVLLLLFGGGGGVVIVVVVLLIVVAQVKRVSSLGVDVFLGDAKFGSKNT
jgi:hypothetical protein